MIQAGNFRSLLKQNDKTMDLQKIKKQREEANSRLFKECGLFFAFSNEQFNENKTPLKDGEKYVSIGSGGYLPKGNFEALQKGMKENEKAYKLAIKTHNLRVKEIVYEFGNHECFYTGDWSVVADMFPDVSKDVIYKLYLKEKKKYVEWCELTGN
jgi:hypothetical protein